EQDHSSNCIRRFCVLVFGVYSYLSCPGRIGDVKRCDMKVFVKNLYSGPEGIGWVDRLMSRCGMLLIRSGCGAECCWRLQVGVGSGSCWCYFVVALMWCVLGWFVDCLGV